MKRVLVVAAVFLPAAAGVAVTPNGAYVYVADDGNDRVQYFKWVSVAFAPASLGRVKALFK